MQDHDKFLKTRYQLVGMILVLVPKFLLALNFGMSLETHGLRVRASLVNNIQTKDSLTKTGCRYFSNPGINIIKYDLSVNIISSCIESVINSKVQLPLRVARLAQKAVGLGFESGPPHAPCCWLSLQS